MSAWKKKKRSRNIWMIPCIVVGVLAFHLLVFYLISSVKPLPQYPYIPPPEPPNFAGYEGTVIDPESGQSMRYREFHVSTKLSENLPDSSFKSEDPHD